MEEQLDVWRRELVPYTTPIGYNIRTLYAEKSAESSIGKTIHPKSSTFTFTMFT